MGRKNRSGKNKRVRSSESDSERQVYKQCKHGGKTSVIENIYEVISKANDILYGEEGDTSIIDSDPETDISVFSPSQPLVSQQNIESLKSAQSNMAAQGSDSVKLDQILKSIQTLQTSQNSMKQVLETKIDKLKEDMKLDIEKKVKGLKDDISLALGVQTTRIDQVVKEIESLSNRVGEIEKSVLPPPGGQANDNAAINGQQMFRPGHVDDSDMSVIVSGLTFDKDENLLTIAQELIKAIDNDVSTKVEITKTVRFTSRVQGKPGLVKVSFRNVGEKILVLRNKMKLKDKEPYKRVYINSCKTRAERLMEYNARSLLRQLPDGRNFRVDASGRIQQRRDPDSQNTH